MTPYEKAQELLDAISDIGDARVASEDWEGYTFPALRYAQLGESTITCEGVNVSATNVVPHAAYGPVDCNASQLGTFTIIIARDCAVIHDRYGIDDPVAFAAVSRVADWDGQLLWDWANEMTAYLSKEWSVAWAIVGNIGVTTMQLTIGVD